MAKARSHQQRQLQRAELCKLMRRGWTVEMIAEEFGLSSVTVEADFRLVIKEYHERHDTDKEAVIALKLQEIAEVKRTAWAAWERSCTEQTIIKEEQFTSSQGAVSAKYAVEKRKPVGDPRFLAVVQDCLRSERELLGLDAKKVMEVSGAHTLNWDVLAKGIPLSGPVPDDVEAEITRAMAALGVPSSGVPLPRLPADIVVPAPPSPVPVTEESSTLSRAGAIENRENEADSEAGGTDRGESKGAASEEERGAPRKRAAARTLEELEEDDL